MELKSKVLVHVCCAPCLCYVLEKLSDNTRDTFLYWFNPNIHDVMEYNRRLDAVKLFTEKKRIVDMLYEREYNPEIWVSNIKKKEKPDRCLECYKLRIEAAANYAKLADMDVLTTTLLYSRYQYHDEIRSIGEKISADYGIEFLYEDFRKGWYDGIRMSKEMGLYRQKYCGCELSKMEN